MHNLHNVCMMEKITHIADSFLLGGLEPQTVQTGAINEHKLHCVEEDPPPRDVDFYVNLENLT